MFMKGNPRSWSPEELLQYRVMMSGHAAGQSFMFDYGVCVVLVNLIRMVAVGFIGKAAKSCFNYRFKDQEALGAYCDKWANGILEWEANKVAERKAASAKPQPFKVGDVLYTSWGYDQTNLDFYEVTKVVGNKMVEIREIHGREVPGNGGGGSMSGHRVPVPGSYCGAPQRRIVKGGSVSADGHNASPAKFKLNAQGEKEYLPHFWSSYH